MFTVPPGVHKNFLFSPSCTSMKGGTDGPAWKMKKYRITRVSNLPSVPRQGSCRAHRSSGPLTSWLALTNPLHQPLKWESRARELDGRTRPEGLEVWQRGGGVELGNLFYLHVLALSSVGEVDLWNIHAILQLVHPNEDNDTVLSGGFSSAFLLIRFVCVCVCVFCWFACLFSTSLPIACFPLTKFCRKPLKLLFVFHQTILLATMPWSSIGTLPVFPSLDPASDRSEIN